MHSYHFICIDKFFQGKQKIIFALCKRRNCGAGVGDGDREIAEIKSLWNCLNHDLPDLFDWPYT